LERLLKGARGVVKINTCGYCGIKIDAEELFCSTDCANEWYENLEESNYDYGE
jgi:predicted nucleic acid-binding Zn ribbon protein